MRTIAHLGNLLVGWTPAGVLSALADTLHRVQPDVVAVAGNLTASGSASELHAAKSLLSQMPSPQVVVPGERDIPFARVPRFLQATTAFGRVIESNPTPCFANSELIVVGVDTARQPARGSAEIQPKHQEQVDSLLRAADAGALRFLVSFRPVFLRDRLAPDASDERVFRSSFDVVLTGPVEPTRKERPFRPNDTALFIPCAAFPQGFGYHLVRLQSGDLILERYVWRNELGDFRMVSTETLHRDGARWTA